MVLRAPQDGPARSGRRLERGVNLLPILPGSANRSREIYARVWSVLAPRGVILVALRPSAAARVELHVDFKERVNAVYHLACLARTIGCTTDAFERFWKERLGWTDADQAALDLWRRT